jgi:hypothetical protein
VIAGSYSLEERMKSVDLDFDRNGFARYIWGLSYAFVAWGAFVVFGRFWNEIHRHGLSLWPATNTLLRIIVLPFFYISPLIFSLQFRRYKRCALKENLVSERVAKNVEYLIGLQLMFVYMAIMLFAIWK